MADDATTASPGLWFLAGILISLGVLTLAGLYGVILIAAGSVVAGVLARRRARGAAWCFVPVAVTVVVLAIGLIFF